MAALRAVIYARISNDPESLERGVQRQIEDCRKHAERWGYEVIGEPYVDNDISASVASKKARPAYDAMLRAAALKQFDVIVTYSNSRLTRRAMEFIELVALINEHGIQINAIVSGKQDLKTADGQGAAITVAIWDQVEAQRTSERVKRAAEQRRVNGEWHGGSVPYGYKVVGDARHRRLVVEPVEANLIREVARRLFAGDTLSSICAEFMRKGITTKRVAPTVVPGGKARGEGSHWRRANLREILLSPATVGYNRARPGTREIGTKFTDEPVLDQRTFERLGALLEQPSRTKASGHSREPKYSLTGGLTVCGRCGSEMVSKMNRGERPIMICSPSVKGAKACGRNRVDHEILEALVLDTVVERFERDPQWFQRHSQPDPKREAAVLTLETERGHLEAGLDRLASALGRGSMDENTYDRQAATLRSELDAVNERLSTMHAGSRMTAVLADGLDWRTWNFAKRRNFLRGVLDGIVVSADGMEAAQAALRQGRVIGQADPEYPARREAILRASYAERVRIVPRSRALVA